MSAAKTKRYSFESQIFPEQSSMIAIGAQVKGGALGDKVDTLVDFNQNLIDRIIPKKDAPTAPEKPDPTEEIKIKADIIIKALGFDPEDIPNLFLEPKLEVSKWGTIKIDLKTMQTNLDGVFAAGDIVRGASLVVWAIKDGRDAAQAMDVYLRTKVEKISKKKVA